MDRSGKPKVGGAALLLLPLCIAFTHGPLTAQPVTIQAERVASGQPGIPHAERVATTQPVVIKAERVLTGTAEGIVGPRFIVVGEGRIVSVTEHSPDGLPASALELHAAFAAPGFVDARTTLGLSGLHPDDDERDESSGPNQAHLRALDAFDLKDPLVESALRGGVTTVQSGPGAANSIGGQAGIFRLGAKTVEGALVRSPSALVLSLVEDAKLTYGKDRRFPSTRMANVGLIRQALLDAGRYRAQLRGESPPSRDLKKEALVMVLEGEVPALVSADRVDELATALRLAEEFGLRLVLVGAADAPVVLDRLAEAGGPVLLGPPGHRASGAEPTEPYPGTPARLRDRSIPFALVTGNGEESARWSLLELARSAVRGGLTLQEALEAITIVPARILGVDGDLGSIEAGKAADLVLFDGDPLEAATRVTAVLVNGRSAYLP
jgi:imidazolonepropionase-like amidohydrolase